VGGLLISSGDTGHYSSNSLCIIDGGKVILEIRCVFPCNLAAHTYNVVAVSLPSGVTVNTLACKPEVSGLNFSGGKIIFSNVPTWMHLHACTILCCKFRDRADSNLECM